MKKFSKVLACMLVTVFTLLAFVACAPNSDPKKAKESLDDAGYTTVLVTSDNLLSSAALSGYESAFGCERGDIVAVLTGVKGGDDSGELITIVYFKDASACKSAWEKAESYFEDENDDDDDSDFTVKKSGKMIYAGTEAAIKAAK